MYEQASIHRWRVVEYLVIWASFCFLLLYSYGYFFLAPYVGFNWTSNGDIYELYVSTSDLRENDQLLQIGTDPWATFRDNLRQPLLNPSLSTTVIPILVQRGTEQVEVEWKLPGFNQAEFVARLTSGWWLGYLFWFAGVLVALLVRPRDQRWWLLIGFTMLTALWLTLGSGISRRHLWDAAVLFRVLLWLCFPVYLHLHWQFPMPLGSLPRVVVVVAYGVGMVGAAAEWTSVLPSYVHLIPFLIGIAGSGILLAVHYRRQRLLRHRLNLLVVATLLAFLPTLVINIVRFFVVIPPALSGGAILGFPLIPFAYVYVASWQQRGWLELRVNPLITIYLFVFILGSLFIPVASLAYVFLGIPGGALAVALLSFVAALVIASNGYPAFRRWVETFLLHVPMVPENVVQWYIEKITTSPNRSSLRETLTALVLPTLLVRQAVLLYSEDVKDVAIWHVIGVDKKSLPTRAEFALLESHSERYLTPTDNRDIQRAFPWIRLILPLRLEGTTQGFWLFGKRDPDDFYAQRELSTLRTLANQTTLAITNILRAEQLAILHRANVARSEQERSALARDLHDEILGNLGMLKTSLDPDVISEPFEVAYALIKRRVRQLATQLRPAMLTYGLQPALSEYLDAVKERYPVTPQVHLHGLADRTRYTSYVELEIFRIVQQAVENAIHHAQASVITIDGELKPDRLDIVIEDNGIGLSNDGTPDLQRLADQKHYGLLGMFERAALVHARLFIEPRPGGERGTCIRVTWTPTHPEA